MTIRLRFHAVERLLGTTLDHIDAAALCHLVDNSVEESSQLEFKAVLDDKWSPDPSELAKDICALANASGGVLIFGIAEAESRADALGPFAKPGGEVRARIAQILNAHARPSPPFEVDVVPADGLGDRVFIVIAVPRSLDAPHARLRSENGETWFQFPVRYETTTTYLSESELSLRYEARHRGFGGRRKRLRGLANDLQPAPADSDREIQMAFAAVPVNAGRFSITEASILEWRRRISAPERAQHSFGQVPQLVVTRHRIRQGRVVLELATREEIDLHADGSLSASLRMDESAQNMLHRVIGHPVAVEDDFLAIRLTAMVHLAAEFASEGAGCAGDLLVWLRLSSMSTDGTLHDMSLVEAPTQFDGHRRPYAGDDATNEVLVETATSIEVLLHPTMTVTVRELHRIYGEIAHGLGVAEPRLTTAQGEVRSSAWPANRQTSLREWATRTSVPDNALSPNC